MSGSRCLPPAIAAAYVSDELDPAAEADVQEHLAGCVACRDCVAILRRIFAAGSAVAEAIEEVGSLVERLLSEPDHRWPLLANEPEYHRWDVVRRLLALAVEERERNTRRAAQMARTAGAIAELLPDHEHGVHDLRFEAAKLESALLREAGRYTECRAALERADRAADRVRDVRLARAAVFLSRALICAEPDIWEPEEALELLDAAERVYRQRRNPERLRAALTVRGMVLFRMGRAAEARARFEEVLERTQSSDELAYADAHANLAQALLETGDFTAAERSVKIATTANMRHGRPVDKARNIAVEARLQQSLDNHEEAVRHAEHAMHEFESCNSSDEAVRAGLIAVQSLLVLQEDDRARLLTIRLAEKSADLDQREPSRRRALTAQAFAYLRQLAVRASLTPDIVGLVRTYLQKLVVKPATSFVPPMPLTEM